MTLFRYIRKDLSFPLELNYIDLLVAIALFFSGIFYAHQNINKDELKGTFYQDQYAPALMEACGRGYTNFIVNEPKVLAFLNLEQESLSCADIPDTVIEQPANSFHRFSRYSLTLASTIWRFEGIKWSALDPVKFFFFGLNAALLFIMFRCFTGRVLSIPFTVILLISSTQLEMVPHLRDFSKSSFIIAICTILVALATKKLSIRQQGLLASMVGLIAGIGFGFRSDLMVMVPLVIFSLMCSRKASTPMYSAGVHRGMLILFFLGAFLVSGWSIIKGNSEGGNLSHVIYLGATSDFDTNLNFDTSLKVLPADTHLFGYRYNDHYANYVINMFHRWDGGQSHLVLGTTEYDKAGFKYLASLLVNFPADFVARTIGSITKAISLDSYSRLISINGHSSLLLFAIASLIIGFLSIRLGFLFVISTLYLFTIPVLQFHIRHYFHLEFVGIAIVLILVTLSLRLFFAIFDAILANFTASVPLSSHYDTVWKNKISHFVYPSAFVIGIISIILLVFSFSRTYQITNMNRILGEIDSIAFKSLSLPVFQFVADDTAKKGIFKPVQPMQSEAGYILIRSNPEKCSSANSFDLIYESDTPFNDHSRNFVVSSEVPEYHLIRVFNYSESKLDRVEVPLESSLCFDIRLINEIPEALPLVDYSVPQARKQVEYRPFQLTPQEITLGKASKRNTTRYVTSSDTPDSELRPLIYQINSVANPANIDSTLFKNYVDVEKQENGSILIDAEPPTPYNYLLAADISLEDGNVIVVNGHLHAGSVSIGLIRDNQWVRQASIQDPGSFRLILKVTNKGKHNLVIANGGGDFVKLEIQHTGIYF